MKTEATKKKETANSYCMARLSTGQRCSVSIPVSERFCKSCNKKLEEKNGQLTNSPN